MILATTELAMVKRILGETVPALEVRAFGSRVGGAPRKTSDLDLVLMTETPLDLATLTDLRDAFTESDLPFKIDLVDWATLDESFQRIINGRYEIVQSPRLP